MLFYKSVRASLGLCTLLDVLGHINNILRFLCFAKDQHDCCV